MINWGKYGIDINQVRGGKGYCPKCHTTRKNRHDRSLSVDKVKGVFNCHNTGCDFKGCAIEDDYMQRQKEKKEYSKPLPRLQLVSNTTLKYFEETRKITNNTLLKFKVTEANEWMPGCEQGQSVQAICFNYYRGEELVNIKFRGPKKSFKMVKDAELIFYNINCIRELNTKDVVIVEGEIDAMSLYECGVWSVISVPNGASMGSTPKLDYLDNCWEYLDKLERIVIATDGDEPGELLAQELIRRLGANRCYRIEYPDGCKDSNEVLVKHGSAAVKEMIDKAELPPLVGVKTAFDVMYDVRKLYLQGFPKTLSLGWGLDEYLRWRLGELTVVTGTPNAGKSTWLSNVVERLASMHGWKTGMFSPEKTPLELIISELAQIHIGKPFYKTDPLQKMNEDEFLKAMQFIEDYFLFLKVDEVEITLDGILAKAEECVQRYGMNCFVCDPWNMLEHKRPDRQSETEYIGECLTKITNFCKKFNVHWFLVAHPTKLQKNKATKQYDIPTMYDIAGSHNFYAKPDNGVVVYRNTSTGQTDVYVQKVRWFFTGKLGWVTCYYHLNSQRFLDHPPVLTYEERMAAAALEEDKPFG